ncbi:MAG: hypothetical protein OHK0012_21360 [Synechococcales cyanobacterium]
MTTLTQRIFPLVSALLRSDSTPAQWQTFALTTLRVVAGTVMIHNGLDKLGDISGFASAYVEVIGLPFPLFFAYVAALTELVAAPLLILGLLTRPAALGLLSTMAVAIYHHIKVAGLSIPYLELSTLYAGVFLLFTIQGAGSFSVDSLLAGMVTADQRQQQIQSLNSSLQVTEQIIQSGAESQVNS